MIFAHSQVDEIERVLNMNALILNHKKKEKKEFMLFGTSKRLNSHGTNLNIQGNNVPISVVREYKLFT